MTTPLRTLTRRCESRMNEGWRIWYGRCFLRLPPTPFPWSLRALLPPEPHFSHQHRNGIAILFMMASLSAEIASSSPAPSAYEFEVEGNMEIAPSGFSAFSSKMHVYVHGCQWRISETWQSATNRIITEIGDDGTNIYRLDHVETNTPSAPSLWGIDPSSWIGAIHRAGFPYRTIETDIVTLFYAYASHCYLDSVTNNFLGPIKFQPTDLKMGDLPVQARIVRDSAAPQLPEQISFLGAQGGRLESTNSFFEASIFTNVGAAHIPLRVSVLRYRPERSSVLVKYEFSVSTARPKCSTSAFDLACPSGTFIQDYRFSHGDANVSPIMVGVLPSPGWPSLEQSKTKLGYRGTRLDWETAARRRRATPSHRKLLVARIALVAAVVTAAAFLIPNVLKRSRTNNNSK